MPALLGSLNQKKSSYSLTKLSLQAWESDHISDYFMKQHLGLITCGLIMNGFNLAEIVPKIILMMRDDGHRSRPVSVGKSLSEWANKHFSLSQGQK